MENQSRTVQIPNAEGNNFSVTISDNDIALKQIQIESEADQMRLERKIDYVLKKTNKGQYKLRRMWYLGNAYNEVMFVEGASIHPQALELLSKLGVVLHYSKGASGIQNVAGYQVVNLEEKIP